MRRLIHNQLESWHRKLERAGRPYRGRSRFVRRQRERKGNVLRARFRVMMRGGKRYTPKEFTEYLKTRK